MYHKIHFFKVYSSMGFFFFFFGIFTKSSNHHIQFQNTFITPKRDLVPVTSHSTFPLSPPNTWLSLIYILSLWICLFWVFHMNEIIQYVVICVLLLSLSIMFFRLIHVA